MGGGEGPAGGCRTLKCHTTLKRMSNENLLNYIKAGDPDPDVVRSMGFGTIADMIPSFGKSEMHLLVDLIMLSQRPESHKDVADTTAGRMIFKACCQDTNLRSQVDQYYDAKGIKDYSVGDVVDGKESVDGHVQMVREMMEKAQE